MHQQIRRGFFQRFKDGGSVSEFESRMGQRNHFLPLLRKNALQPMTEQSRGPGNSDLHKKSWMQD